MNHPKHVIPEKQLRDLISKGQTTSEIGKITGFSNSIVRANLRRYGLTYNRPVPHCLVLTKEQIEEASLLYEGGASTYTLAKRFNVHQSVMWRAFKRVGKDLRSVENDYRKYRLNETVFDVIDTEQKAYWLGFLYADGGLVYYKRERITAYLIRFALKKTDYHMVERLRDFLYPDKDMPIKKVNGKFPSRHVNIHSKHMFKSLIKLGCTLRKSLTLRFPTSDKVPDHLVRHFIRGYFDGDGCITWNRKKYRVQPVFSIISSSFFVKEFKSLMERQGVYIGLCKHKHSPNTWRAATSKQSAIRYLYDYIYSDATVFLQRKKDKYQTLIKLIDERSTIV